MIRIQPLLKATLALLALSMAVTALARGPHSGLSDGIKAVPIAGKLSGEVTFVPFFPTEPGETGPCEGYNFLTDPDGNMIPGSSIQTVSSTEGQLERIGRVALYDTHCAEYTPDGNSTSKAGWAAFTTPTGDTIYGTYDAVPLVPPPMDIGDLIIQEGVTQIVGGTGAFAGATGQLTFRVYVRFEGLGDFFWPLEYVVSGLIHVPE